MTPMSSGDSGPESGVDVDAVSGSGSVRPLLFMCLSSEKEAVDNLLFGLESR